MLCPTRCRECRQGLTLQEIAVGLDVANPCLIAGHSMSLDPTSARQKTYEYTCNISIKEYNQYIVYRGIFYELLHIQDVICIMVVLFIFWPRCYFWWLNKNIFSLFNVGEAYVIEHLSKIKDWIRKTFKLPFRRRAGVVRVYWNKLRISVYRKILIYKASIL